MILSWGGNIIGDHKNKTGWELIMFSVFWKLFGGGGDVFSKMSEGIKKEDEEFRKKSLSGE